MSIWINRVLLILIGMVLNTAIQMCQNWIYYKRARAQLKREMEEEQSVEDFIKILQAMTNKTQQHEE